jgi:hypothetical protein
MQIDIEDVATVRKFWREQKRALRGYKGLKTKPVKPLPSGYPGQRVNLSHREICQEALQATG